MALVNRPILECPRGHELVRVAWRVHGEPLRAVTLCPRCYPLYADTRLALAERYPVCAIAGCPAPAQAGERYCAKCRDELDALRAFVWQRQRQRKAAA